MSMRRIRAIVIDDEPLARSYLRTLLANSPDVEIVGEAADGRSAIAAIRDLQPELLFLDVQMPSLDGFELVERLGEASLPYVVFVTAYDQYALKAFEVHALDYLLKPFDGERLARSVRRAATLIRGGASGIDLKERLLAMLGDLSALERPISPVRIPVRSDGRIRFVEVERIDWIEASDKVSRLHVGKDVHVLRDSLTNLEEQLDPARFVRIHRSVIVNVARIREMQPWFQGDFVVILHDGTRLTSGRAYRQRLQAIARRGTGA
jgi:two-component system LytT family response regulator